ncbi:MAG: hypothetical protein KGL70_01585 [Betaproteobacteria bacterium]|nr:hypothetical protein [Betaproteobacteria bacterium]
MASIATLAAWCALVTVLAWWGWQLFGPAPVQIAAVAPRDPAATIVAANLFAAGSAPAATRATASDATLAGDARLLGIIAEPAKDGYALFSLPGGPKVVKAGQDITPGARVTSITPNTVTVREGAIERELRLRPEGGAGLQSAPGIPGASGIAVPAVSARASAGGAPPPSRSTIAGASCAAPAGFDGAIVRLNAELLGGLGSDTAAWRGLLAATPRGLVVTQANGYAAMLGLKVGDRISQANGIALRSPDDVTSAVLRPLIANQGVRIVGSRNGAPQELWLANVACSE